MIWKKYFDELNYHVDITYRSNEIIILENTTKYYITCFFKYTIHLQEHR